MNEPWVLALLVAVAAIAAGFVAHAILLAVLRRLFRLSVVASELVRHIDRPARLVLPVFALDIAVALAPGMLEIGLGVRDAVTLLTVGALTWLLVRAVGGVAAAVVVLHPVDIGDNLDTRDKS